MKAIENFVFFLTFLFLFSTINSFSQNDNSQDHKQRFKGDVKQNISIIKDARKRDYQIHRTEGKNLFKLTASDILFTGLGISYEREILPHFGLQIHIRYCDNYQIPVVLLVDNFLNGAVSKQLKNLDLFNTILKNYSFTLEPRFYSRGRKNLHFYWGPYLRYENVEINIPFNLYNNNVDPPEKKKLIIDGVINGIYAGINIGIRKNLSPRWVFEFDIFGIGYGEAEYKVIFKANEFPLTPDDQQEIRADIESVNSTAKQNNIILQNFKYNVQERFVNISFTGPYIGIRGIGASIVYRF